MSDNKNIKKDERNSELKAAESTAKAAVMNERDVQSVTAKQRAVKIAVQFLLYFF